MATIIVPAAPLAAPTAASARKAISGTRLCRRLQGCPSMDLDHQPQDKTKTFVYMRRFRTVGARMRTAQLVAGVYVYAVAEDGRSLLNTSAATTIKAQGDPPSRPPAWS